MILNNHTSIGHLFFHLMKHYLNFTFKILFLRTSSLYLRYKNPSCWWGLGMLLYLMVSFSLFLKPILKKNKIKTRSKKKKKPESSILLKIFILSNFMGGEIDFIYYTLSKWLQQWTLGLAEVWSWEQYLCLSQGWQEPKNWSHSLPPPREVAI